MGSLVASVRRLDVRDLVREVLHGYREADLLTYGSAIAFQVMFAIIPLALFGLGLLGFLGLDDVYRDKVAPDLQSSVSPDMFGVVDDTVRRVLGSKQLWWITVGAVVAVWEMSGAVRAVMQVFDRIYDSDRERGFRERYVTSILLAIGAGVLLLAAVAVAQGLPLIVDGPVSWLRWPVAIVLMTIVVALFVRYAPAAHRPWQMVSLGAVIVIVAWTATSIVFGLYVTRIADYGSIFGNLATVIIVFEYLYLAACAFLTGALIDAILSDSDS
jgi:membrane protein